MRKKTDAEQKRPRFNKSTRRRIHERLLFHWIGSHIESQPDLSEDDQRGMYVDCLKGSLRPDGGLWLNPPRDDDILLDGEHFKIQSPICCFTESSLEDIADHASRYGRLGLGFPKRFVLERGGRPVNYVLDKASDPTMKAWLRLARTLRDDDLLTRLTESQRKDIEQNLSFVTHFLKRIKQPPSQRPPRPPSPRQSEKKAPVNKKKNGRSFGGPLHYLEEREWRFVVQKHGRTVSPKGAVPNKQASGPQWYLPYIPGKDLFTIVFPDNQTMAAALRDRQINETLFNTDRPHITLLTLEDIGTF